MSYPRRARNNECDPSDKLSQVKGGFIPPDSKIAQGSYQRHCLVDSTCSAEEKKNAIYDYVGAAYGEKGKVAFNKPGSPHILTPAEKEYVTKKFGVLPENPKAADVDAYLSGARRIFFKDLGFPTDPYCQSDGRASLAKFNHAQWGAALVLLGRHGCGENYGNLLLQSGVELAMAANPSPWTIYLESYGTPIFQKVKLEEMALFSRLAEVSGIPLKNPLPYQASSMEVRKKAAAQSKLSVEDFAVMIVFQAAVNSALSKQRPGDPAREIFRREMPAIIKAYAPELSISEDVLLQKIQDFLRTTPVMQDQLRLANERGELLATISNRMNHQALAKQFATNKSKSGSQALFVLGAQHLDLVKAVYSSKK